MIDQDFVIQLSPLKAMRVRDILSYINKPGYLIYNGANGKKLRMVQIERTRIVDGKKESYMGDSMAMLQGATNILQHGELPSENPGQWKIVDGRPELMDKEEQKAADTSRADVETDRKRSKVIDKLIADERNKLDTNAALATLLAASEITQVEHDDRVR